MPGNPFAVPKLLVDAIKDGDCVAFVGAGFSAPSTPTWQALLEELGATDPDVRSVLQLDRPERNLTSRDYETAAQILRDKHGARLEDLVKEVFEGWTDDRSTVDRRVAVLRRIPFHTILTTNFDGILKGREPNPSSYARLLRSSGSWKSELFMDGLGAEVLNLHGNVKASDGRPIVLSTRDYRERIHADHRYSAFLRSLLGSRTVLYLGVSFTDSYLNELRSEVLNLIGFETGATAVGYAVTDASVAHRNHLKKHEGIESLSYDSGGGDHTDFDRWLEAIEAATSPKAQLGAVLARKRVLWFDDNPRNNGYGSQVLTAALGPGDDPLGSPSLQQVGTLEEAMDSLLSARNEGRPFDLLITKFGFEDPPGPSQAETLLDRCRSAAVSVPTLVFAADDEAHSSGNKRRMLSAGAVGYHVWWPDLFDGIERVFSDPFEGLGKPTNALRST